MNAILIGVIVYVLLQFLIGYLVSRQIRSEADYILAGRRLGLGLAAFSIFATWFGAESIIGSSGQIYESGLSLGIAEPFAYGAALLLMGLLFARPLWNRGLTTFGDLFRQRFSPGVEKLAIFLILPGPIFWGAAQIRAFGQIVGATSGIDVDVAITIAAVVVIAYTVLGGLMADALTDLIQGLALIFGLIALLVAVAWSMGGMGALVAAIPAERTAYFSLGEASWLEVAEEWAIPIFGSLVAVELISRILATRSAGVAQSGAVVGSGLYLIVGAIPVLVALVGPQLVPNIADPEQIVPTVAQAYLPGFLYVVFAGALISAILSTVDSVILSGASLVSHNIIVPLRPKMTEVGKLLTARICVVALGVIAYILSLLSGSIYELVETASAFGSAGLFVVVAFGMFTRFGGPLAATATLAIGAGVWFAGTFFLEWTAPYLTALVAALITYPAVALTVEGRVTA